MASLGRIETALGGDGGDGGPGGTAHETGSGGGNQARTGKEDSKECGDVSTKEVRTKQSSAQSSGSTLDAVQSPRGGTSQGKTSDLAHSSSSFETDSILADGASTDSSHASAISPRSPRPIQPSHSPPIPRSASGGIPSTSSLSVSPSRSDFTPAAPGSPSNQGQRRKLGRRTQVSTAQPSNGDADDEGATDCNHTSTISPSSSPPRARSSGKARTPTSSRNKPSPDSGDSQSPSSPSDSTEIHSPTGPINEYDNIEAFEDRSRWLARLQFEHPSVQDVRQRVRPFARTLAFARSFDVKPQFPPEDILTGAMPPEKRPFAEIVMGLVMQHLHAVGLQKTVASIHQELDRLAARPSDHMEEYFIDDALLDSKLDNSPDSASNNPLAQSTSKSDRSRGGGSKETRDNNKLSANATGASTAAGDTSPGEKSSPRRKSAKGERDGSGRSAKSSRNAAGSTASPAAATGSVRGRPGEEHSPVGSPTAGGSGVLGANGETFRPSRSPFADLAEHFANTTFRKDQAFFERDLRESPLVTMIRSSMVRAQEVYDLAMADRPATRTLGEAQLEEKLYALGMLEDEDDISDDVDIWEEGPDPEEDLNSPQSAFSAPYGSNVQPANLGAASRPGSGRYHPYAGGGSPSTANGLNMAPSSPSIPGSSGISISGSSGNITSHSAGAPIIAPIAGSLPTVPSGALTERSDRADRASILLGVSGSVSARTGGGDYSPGSPTTDPAALGASKSGATAGIGSRRVSSPAGGGSTGTSGSARNSKIVSPSSPASSNLLGAGGLSSDKSTLSGVTPPSSASQPPSHLLGRLSGGGAITAPPVDDSIRGRRLIYDYWVDVEEGEERPIRAATLNKLVEIATSSKLANLQYTPTFLMTYKSFTTPKKLFEKLKQRWSVPLSAAEDQGMTLEQYANPIRLRWIAFSKKWLTEYPEDIDRNLLTDMRRFTNVMMEEPGMRNLTNSVVTILDKLAAQMAAQHASASSSAYQTASVIGGHGFSFQSLIGQTVSPYAYASALVFSATSNSTYSGGGSASSGSSASGSSVSGSSSLTSSSLIPSGSASSATSTSGSGGAAAILMSIRGPSGTIQSATSPQRKVTIPAGTPPVPKVPKNIFHPTLTLYQIDQEEVARQLTLMDSNVFMAIKPSELLNQSWGKPKLKHLAPNVLRMVALSNQLSHSISTHILQGQKPKDRAKIIEWWVRVAEHCKNLSNYHGVMAVISGINSGPTVRLKYSRREVSKALMDQLNSYEKIFESDGSFANYRATLAASVPPVIPYLGIHQTDLTFIEEGNKDMHGHLINFAKRRLIYQTIAALQNYQQTGYNLQPVRQIQDLIANLKPADTKDLFKVSLLREPRESSR